MAKRFNAKSEEKMLLKEHRLRTLDEETLTDFDQAWMDKVERRYRVLKEGKVVGIPAEEVSASIRAEMKLKKICWPIGRWP